MVCAIKFELHRCEFMRYIQHVSLNRAAKMIPWIRNKNLRIFDEFEADVSVNSPTRKIIIFSSLCKEKENY
jgi:hypothetical protein